VRRVGFRVGFFALLVSFVLAACGGGKLGDLAEDTCEQLEDSIVLTAGLIVQTAIDEAEDLGYTAPELGVKMREECPGIMAALENIGEDQVEREIERAERENLPNLIGLELEGCFSDEARGTVTNNSDVKVGVFIDVAFTDDNGVLIDSGLGSVSGLDPGQTGIWDASFFGDDYARCRADIGSVFES